MNIKEIESASGMARAGIRYYEKEGLLAPMRRENGYRDYSPRDLEELKRIRLLRELGLSLEQIKEAQRQPPRLSALLEKAMDAAGQELETRRHAMAVCGEIKSRELSYDELFPDPYLERLYSAQENQREKVAAGERKQRGESGSGRVGTAGEKVAAGEWEQRGESGSMKEELWRDKESPALHPFRRFLARGADLLGYRLCVVLLWNGALSMPFQTKSLGSLLWAWAALGLMLLAEPLFLAALGTTPGKWLFGIRIYREEGGKLTYREGLKRTGQVILRGLGLCIPLWEQYCGYQSWKRCVCEGRTEWDDETDCQVKERAGWRLCLTAFAVICGFLGGVCLTLMWRMLPPNRGELTLAEFAENYNYYVRRAAQENGTWDERILAGLMLKEDGQFPSEGGRDGEFLPQYSGVAVQTSREPDVELVYLLEGEFVRGISFEQSIREPGMSDGYVDEMQYAALAYLAADERVTVLNGGMGRLLNTLSSRIKAFQDYEFEADGVLVECHVERGEEMSIRFQIQ